MFSFRDQVFRYNYPDFFFQKGIIFFLFFIFFFLDLKKWVGV